MTLIFISHDLSVVGQISDRIAVMYLGNIVEMGKTEAIFHQPKHPYTQALMDAVPKPNPKIRIRKGLVLGEPPSRLEPQPGCAFAPRCPLAKNECLTHPPSFRAIEDQRMAMCHLL